MGQSLQHGVANVNPVNVVSDTYDHKVIEFRTDQTNFGKPTQDRIRFITVDDKFSPANAFARRMYQQHNMRDIVIAVAAFGGHGITRFLDPARRVEAPLDGGNDRHDECVDFINGAVRALQHGGHTVNFRGFNWFQGSSDGASQELKDAYQTHLERVVADFRAEVDIATTSTKWLVTRSPQGGQNSNWPSSGDERHRAQETVASNDSNAAWHSCDDPLGTTNVFSDGTHPDGDSTERIGCAMADAWVSNFGT